MAYTNGTCYVCDEKKPVQSHHLIPLEFGGPKKGPQVDLCPTCHLTCHYEAEMFCSTGSFFQLETTYIGEVLNRAKKIIDYIVKAKLAFEAGDEHAKDARRRINLSFSHDELMMVHALKKVLGFKSLERMIKSIIASAIRQERGKGKI